MTNDPKIAAIVTKYFKHSHAHHIVDRFLEGYGWNGQHHRPAVDLVSMYVDQVDDEDLSGDRFQRFTTVKKCDSISEALTLGGSKLAVDGVLLIGEHGEYGTNEKGQYLFPRYEFFKQIVQVFADSGRSVPVFNDKHLSWKWQHAKEMYDLSQQMGFAFMAGSSLPVTWRLPPIDMPMGAKVNEALCIGYGGVDSYDFHGLETIQCMVERRAGGESGVQWIQAYKNENFWKAFDEHVWSHELFQAALLRSHNVKLESRGSNTMIPTVEQIKATAKEPIAYRYRHADGLKCTMILLNGFISDFNVAASLAGAGNPLSTQMYLQMPSDNSALAGFFSPLCQHIEQMFLTGKANYPLERALLTTGLTEAAVDSLHQGQKRVETPHLDVVYQPPSQSMFWQT